MNSIDYGNECIKRSKEILVFWCEGREPASASKVFKKMVP